MHSRLVTIRPAGWVALAFLALGGVVHASAPGDQYKFFAPGDATITDQQTHLVWQRRILTEPMSFSDAHAACETFGIQQAEDGLWRLPTVKELLTLVDEQMYGVFENGEIVYRPVDRNAFPDTPRDLFWSSTRDSDQLSNDIWLVNFENGTTVKRSSSLGSSKFHVRCVRND